MEIYLCNIIDNLPGQDVDNKLDGKLETECWSCRVLSLPQQSSLLLIKSSIAKRMKCMEPNLI